MRQLITDPESRRRSFLFRMLVGLQSLCALIVGLPLLRAFLAPLSQGSGVSEWVQVGPERDVPEGGTALLRYRRKWRDGYRDAVSTGVVVVSRRGAALTALSAMCTHLGCQVGMDRARAELACPCHGGRFALDGRVLAGPPPRPLDALEVKSEGGFIWIRHPITPS